LFEGVGSVVQDVIIIGAGISGLSCACFLRRRGLRVLVLEKASVIGGRIEENIQGFPYWEIPKINLNIPCQCPVNNITVWTPESESVRFHFKRPVLYLVKRGPAPDSFDRWLAEQAAGAGAEIRLGCEVTGLLENENGFSGVRTTSGEDYQAKFLIAADGPASTVRRMAGLIPLDIKGVAFGERVFGTGLTPLAVEVFFARGVSPYGYGYLISYPDGRYATAAVSSKHGHLKTNIKECYSQFRPCLDFALKECIAENHFSGAITCGDGTQVLEKNNLFFIGEAGGFQDPTFGFGMGPCIRSAELCSEIVAKSSQPDYCQHFGAFTEKARLQFFQNEIGHRRDFRNNVIELLNDGDFSAVIKCMKGREEAILNAMNGGDFTSLLVQVGRSLLFKRPSLARLIPQLMASQAKSSPRL
jgi:flavin-dependent dehydrogenase